MVEFILKVMGVSIALAFVIKYGGPFLAIPATPISALVGVLTPTVVMLLLLAWRWQQQKQRLQP
jgi:membrane protein implicated in regulation of membrane protease activity